MPAQKIISENFPKDTEEEAELISPRVQGTKVVLITNADHMPRSINYFQSQGVYPLQPQQAIGLKILMAVKIGLIISLVPTN